MACCDAKSTTRERIGVVSKSFCPVPYKKKFQHHGLIFPDSYSREFSKTQFIQ